MNILFLLLMALLSLGSAGAQTIPVMPLGTPAPDFRLPGTDGREYTLQDFAEAKVLAIVFTSNHCPTAQAYEERIKRLAADYAARGVRLVAINPNHAPAVRLDELGYTDLDDTFDAMKIRAQHQEFNFPYLDDGPSETISKLFGPVATPHIFIFDAGRRLRYQGRIDDSEREDLVKARDARHAIEALLAGQEPPVRETKVFGCSVKWAHKAESNQRWLEKVKKEPVALEPASAEVLRGLRANTSGKVRLINVWATWCGPCVSEFPELVATNLRFRQRDFELVTVAAHFPDEKNQVLRFLEKQAASTRNFYFGETDKYRLFEALDPAWKGGLPHTLLIAPGGEILLRQTEEIDFLELRRKIVAALNKIAPWPGMTDAR